MRADERLAGAKRFIRSAELLLEDGDYASVASRCYYSMFLCAEAMLYTKGIRTHTHKGMIALFGKTFVKTGVIASVYAKALRSIYDLRNRGDYATGMPVDRTDAEVAIDRAKGFLMMAEDWLSKT